MPKPHNSPNRIKIDKANTVMLVAISVAVFVLIFTLFAVKTYVNEYAYQSHVISAKKQAKSQLVTDVAATTKLTNSYKSFVSSNKNLLGGNPNGQGPKDGDNAKIILDALPSSYDYPGFIAGLKDLMSNNGVALSNFSGTDDQVAQQSTKPSGSPTPVQVPFEISTAGNYASIQKMVSILENSIRPINITSLELTGTDKSLQAHVKAYTYYQPATAFTIGTEEVK